MNKRYLYALSTTGLVTTGVIGIAGMSGMGNIAPERVDETPAVSLVDAAGKAVGVEERTVVTLTALSGNYTYSGQDVEIDGSGASGVVLMTGTVSIEVTNGSITILGNTTIKSTLGLSPSDGIDGVDCTVNGATPGGTFADVGNLTLKTLTSGDIVLASGSMIDLTGDSAGRYAFNGGHGRDGGYVRSTVHNLPDECAECATAPSHGGAGGAGTEGGDVLIDAADDVVFYESTIKTSGGDGGNGGWGGSNGDGTGGTMDPLSDTLNISGNGGAGGVGGNSGSITIRAIGDDIILHDALGLYADAGVGGLGGRAGSTGTASQGAGGKGGNGGTASAVYLTSSNITTDSGTEDIYVRAQGGRAGESGDGGYVGAHSFNTCDSPYCTEPTIAGGGSAGARGNGGNGGAVSAVATSAIGDNGNSKTVTFDIDTSGGAGSQSGAPGDSEIYPACDTECFLVPAGGGVSQTGGDGGNGGIITIDAQSGDLVISKSGIYSYFETTGGIGGIGGRGSHGKSCDDDCQAGKNGAEGGDGGNAGHVILKSLGSGKKLYLAACEYKVQGGDGGVGGAGGNSPCSDDPSYASYQGQGGVGGSRGTGGIVLLYASSKPMIITPDPVNCVPTTVTATIFTLPLIGYCGVEESGNGNAGATGADGITITGPECGCDPDDSICFADCDKRDGAAGVLDIYDFLCFQGKFTAGDAYACNCDVSTGFEVCDVFDFLCFQEAFVAGCP